MALEQGNMTRGLALMRMARRDGDPRAERYLVQRNLPLVAEGSPAEAPLAELLATWTVTAAGGR
jgi:hypothetical protein